MKKTNRIFLVSSLEQEKTDEISQFLHDVSDITEKEYGVEFISVHSIPSVQDDDPGHFDLAFFIFSNSMGETERKKLVSQREFIQKSDIPTIYMLLVDIPEQQKSVSFREFMKSLPSIELLHYADHYLDEMKLHILFSIKLLVLDFLSLDVKEDGMCCINGHKVLSLAHIAAFANCGLLKQMKKDFANQKNNIIALQEDLFVFSLNMFAFGLNGTITERQKKACQLFDLGDYEGCLTVLNTDKINSGYPAWKDGQTADPSAFIMEHQTIIAVLKVMRHDEDREDCLEKIRAHYEQILPVALEFHKEPMVLLGYARFLHAQNDLEHAVQIADKIRDTFPAEEHIVLYYGLGDLYLDAEKWQDAIDAYQKTILIIEKQAAENPGAYERHWANTNYSLAYAYHSLAHAYSLNLAGNFLNAEEMYLKAISIYEDFSEDSENSLEIYGPNLIHAYTGLADLYKRTKTTHELKEVYKKTAAILEKLAAQDPEMYEAQLSCTYNDLGVLYSKSKQFAECEKMYRKATEIRERLCEQNPDQEIYKSGLAFSYNNLGALFCEIEQFQEAVPLLKKAIAIQEKLAAQNPESYEQDLFYSYSNLGTLYHNTGQIQESDEMYRKAAAIREKISAQNQTADEPATRPGLFRRMWNRLKP